ncbi:unnamed protein product [Caenorhabditis sp. 36 PRJEB53466]|nr:unnamed protein product [Caenorhabditis sp. 36 PRJEB53466]
MKTFFGIVLVFAFVATTFAAFGHGRSALNDADDASAVQPLCPTDRAGNKYVPCPSPLRGTDTWPCVRLSDLCNTRRDCPNGEDENPFSCFYHKSRFQEIDQLRKLLEEIKG